MIEEGQLLWSPEPEWIADTNLAAFRQWLSRERNLEFDDYHSLWRWSVENLEDFWSAVWAYFDIKTSAPYTRVLENQIMPGAKWFSGARLNYAENILRQERPDTARLGNGENT